MDQEEEDIVFWELEELRNQEFEEIEEEIERVELDGDDTTTHETWAEIRQVHYTT